MLRYDINDLYLEQMVTDEDLLENGNSSLTSSIKRKHFDSAYKDSLTLFTSHLKNKTLKENKQIFFKNQISENPFKPTLLFSMECRWKLGKSSTFAKLFGLKYT